MKLKSYLFSIFSLFLLCGIPHAGEQDNWYIADEWTVNQRTRYLLRP